MQYIEIINVVYNSSEELKRTPFSQGQWAIIDDFGQTTQVWQHFHSVPCTSANPAAQFPICKMPLIISDCSNGVAAALILVEGRANT